MKSPARPPQLRVPPLPHEMTLLSELTLKLMTFAFRLATNHPEPLQGLVNDGPRLEVLHEGQGDMQPVLSVDFPDPSVIQSKEGTWYAFATESEGRSVQVARTEGSDPFGRWRVLDIDALPDANTRPD